MAFQVAVCGPRHCTDQDRTNAYRVGQLLAEHGVVVVCGGGIGVMAAVAARNAIIVWSADAVIAIGASWGTLSEIALAKRRGGIPVISLGGWQILGHDGLPVEGIQQVANPDEAVTAALEAAAAPQPGEAAD